MQTITVELMNEEALALLHQLEQFNVLKVVATSRQQRARTKRQWAGSISENTANRMLRSVEQSRDEWERSF